MLFLLRLLLLSLSLCRWSISSSHLDVLSAYKAFRPSLSRYFGLLPLHMDNSACLLCLSFGVKLHIHCSIDVERGHFPGEGLFLTRSSFAISQASPQTGFPYRKILTGTYRHWSSSRKSQTRKRILFPAIVFLVRYIAAICNAHSNRILHVKNLNLTIHPGSHTIVETVRSYSPQTQHSSGKS